MMVMMPCSFCIIEQTSDEFVSSGVNHHTVGCILGIVEWGLEIIHVHTWAKYIVVYSCSCKVRCKYTMQPVSWGGVLPWLYMQSNLLTLPHARMM